MGLLRHPWPWSHPETGPGFHNQPSARRCKLVAVKPEKLTEERQHQQRGREGTWLGRQSLCRTCSKSHTWQVAEPDARPRARRSRSWCCLRSKPGCLCPLPSAPVSLSLSPASQEASARCRSDMSTCRRLPCRHQCLTLSHVVSPQRTQHRVSRVTHAPGQLDSWRGKWGWHGDRVREHRGAVRHSRVGAPSPPVAKHTKQGADFKTTVL